MSLRIIGLLDKIIGLLDKLKKRDTMRGFLSILSLFSNKFNRFNDTGGRMLHYIYYMALTFLTAYLA